LFVVDMSPNIDLPIIDDRTLLVLSGEGEPGGETGQERKDSREHG
jgi:hypothetical protein